MGLNYYAECLLCWVLLILSVTKKSLMLSVIVLNVVMMSVVMLNVVVPTNNDHNKLVRHYVKKSFTAEINSVS